MMLLVSTCCSNVTFADDDSGDYSEEHGFIDEDRPTRVKDAIREIQGYDSLSAWPATVDSCSHVRASRSNLHGLDREETIHLKHSSGRELTSRELFRIYRAAGLTEGAI